MSELKIRKVKSWAARFAGVKSVKSSPPSKFALIR